MVGRVTYTGSLSRYSLMICATEEALPDLSGRLGKPAPYPGAAAAEDESHYHRNSRKTAFAQLAGYNDLYGVSVNAAAGRNSQACTRVVLFGASGHARVIADLLERSGLFEVAGLIVSNLPAGTACFGYHVLGSEVDLPALIEQYGIQADPLQKIGRAHV